MIREKIRFCFFVIVSVLQVSSFLYAQDSKNMSYQGNFGKGEGQCKAVYALGSLVYYGVGDQLKIADFTTPVSPAKLGSLSLGNTIEDLVRSGNYAYVAAGSKVFVVNVKNPLKPAIEGSLEVSGYGEGIATKTTYVFVAAGDGGLRIIDASVPASPKEIAKVDTIGYAEGVSVSGDYVYVATGSKVRIINISNPASPVYAGHIADPLDWYQSVTVRGNYAYVCDYSYALRIVDVSNPAAPVIKSDIQTGSRTSRVQLDGNYAFVANGDSMRIIDVTNASAPVKKSAMKMNYRAVSLWVGIEHVYVADLNSGLQCINIANPSVPGLKSSLEILAPATGTAYGVFSDDNKAYVAYGSAGLRVVDVTVPSSPSLLGEIALTGDSRQVVVKDKIAFVAARDGGVRVINTADPKALAEITAIQTPRARGIAISGNYVFVAASDSGMVIIDAANAENPVWVKSVSKHYGEGVCVSGNVAAVSDYSNIKLYDITNPLSPVMKGETGALKTGTAGMSIYKNYLLVPDFDTLKVFDISDLNKPVLKHSVYSGASWDGSVVVENNYAYVAAEENGVRVFDLTNPLALIEIAYFKNTSSVRGLAVSNGVVYAAVKGDGLSVFTNDLVTSVEESGNMNPSEFALMQNYPNPFNPSTVIRFTLPQASNVQLRVYNVLGQIVREIADGFYSSGVHTVSFDASGLSAGIYMYELRTAGFSSAKKMLFLK